MRGVWIRRLWGLAAGLLAAVLSALGVAGVLFAVGDLIGQQALFGVAAVTAFVFLVDMVVLAISYARFETAQNLSDPRRS